MSDTSNPAQDTKITLSRKESYREVYANSVQVKMSVWDFQLIFGTLQQEKPDEVAISNESAVYLSPQQAKALWNILGQNLAQYEQTFGKLHLEPQLVPPAGPIH